MSVILFDPSDVYQEMADAYEGLKHRLHADAAADARFYKALRRIYYANVATFLCQYHDDTPLTPDELGAISPFQTVAGDARAGGRRTPAELARQFLSAWSLLTYNLVTNDGEMYRACESFEQLEALALRLAALGLEAEGAAA
jgi:Ser/Thr protein kinase RdoA (MazF antagonist)